MNEDKNSKNKRYNEIRMECPVDEYCYGFLKNDTLGEYNISEIQKPQSSMEAEISEIKYPVKTDDNADTKLVKNLINIIYAYENDIVNHIRKIGKSYEFQLKIYESKFQRFEGNIGMKNIAKLLGISYSNIKRNWTQLLKNDLDIDFYFKSFFKIFHNTNKYFPKNVKILADDAISVYLENMGYANDLRISLSLIFNDYVNKALGFADISFLLGRSNTYLNILSEKLKDNLEFEQVKKYFNLLSNIFFLKSIDFENLNIKLKNSKSIEKVK